MRWRFIVIFLMAIVSLCLAAAVIYNLPPVHERLAWRVTSWTVQIRRIINPPEKVLFVPQGAGAVETIAKATLDALLPSTTPVPSASLTPVPMQDSPTPLPSSTSFPTPTLTLTPTPIPPSVALTGIVHEYQQFNNCGPANLAMALSYWGWQGDQRDTRAYLRPNLEVDDKNVMPAEMAVFVENYTNLHAMTRVGGDLDLLKRLIAAGFPVLIEAGHHPRDDWWMGHYQLISAYDDASGRLTVQDSLISPDLPFSYDEISTRWWRDFNYVYLLIYPPEREAEILSILGPRADEVYSYQYAAQTAQREIQSLEGRDLFFAWFNLGSSQVGLGDYAAAASAYDQAFSLYQGLSEEQRPYRLMWYQIGPYIAYYNTQRYQDVINLANATFSWVGQPVLEESYYWRGLAYQALGDMNRATSDFKKAASLNPNYTPPREALTLLGVQFP
jgi:hypothetical protein